MLALLLLAGCTADDEQAGPAERGSSPASVETPSISLSPVPLQDVQVNTSVEPRWVRPSESLNATATFEGGGSVDWFVASRNPIREATPPPLSDRAQPGGAAGFRLRDEGRHVFDVGGARLVVSIVQDLPPGTFNAVANATATDWVVTPHAFRGGPASTVTVENRGSTALLVEREDVETYLGTGASLSFAMPVGFELGDYDVVATVVDDERAGESKARVVYDRRKPDEMWSLGPFRGTIENAATAEPDTHALKLDFASQDVRVEVAAASEAPLPYALVVRLLDGNGTEISSGEAPGFDMASVPKGDATLVVEATEGALVEYEVHMMGRYLLEPPASFFNS